MSPLPPPAHRARLHAATHGLGSGKPLLVLLHGFPETWAAWRHQIKVQALSGHGPRVSSKWCNATDASSWCQVACPIPAPAPHTDGQYLDRSAALALLPCRRRSLPGSTRW